MHKSIIYKSSSAPAADETTNKSRTQEKVLSARDGAGQRVGNTKVGPRASPNRSTQTHKSKRPALGTRSAPRPRPHF